LGGLLGEAELLGQRTAELHDALGAPTDDPAFAPEPYTSLDRRALYQSMRTRSRRTLQALGRRRVNLTGTVLADAEAVLEAGPVLEARFHRLLEVPVRSLRIRTHGDYHLGQVLFTGRDFVIVDFEGEPARSIGERRLKHTAMRDIAGMIRSYDYAARVAVAEVVHDDDDDRSRSDAWATAFGSWASVAFMRGYRSVPLPDGIRPEEPAEDELLFEVFLLDKAVYEIGYELDSRPDFVRLPLAGLRHLLEGLQ
jgi:maltose alpha-D-glucosyltransferase/alpha-amylase